MTKIKTNSSNIEPKAFTLLELMLVIGVIVLVSTFVVPAFTNLKSSGDVNSAVYNIGGVLEQARSYAMANRTYVWVGIEEVDASKDPSVNPQTIGIGASPLPSSHLEMERGAMILLTTLYRTPLGPVTTMARIWLLSASLCVLKTCTWRPSSQPSPTAETRRGRPLALGVIS